MIDKIYFGGNTTDPEIKALLERLPPDTMKPGDVFSYADLESIVNAKWKSNRWKTVTDRWRRKLFHEHNIDTKAVTGVGFAVLHAHERLDEGLRGVRSGHRKVRKSGKRIGSADPKALTEKQRKKQDHAGRLLLGIDSALSAARREIESAGRIVALPRKASG